MAKTDLNPGADATLVSAAYRSAAGNTPGDYSGALESVVQGYEKTMEAQSEAWGNVAKLGANIGSEMIANAEELTSYVAKTSGLDPEGAAFLENEIYANKDAQKALGFLDFSRETRKERAKLKLKQKELFAEIDLAVESINVGADNIANGLYDAELANLNEGDAEKVNAIIKSNLKDKNTENGNYAKLGRDENTGELMYTLYDSDTNEPTMLNGKPQTMTIKEFNKSIANNVKDTKNVVGTNLGGIINDIVTGAQKGRNGVIAPQMTQMGLNRLDGALQTDTDLRRAMLSKYGIKNTSFVDDITSKGTVSADLYGSMLKQLGLGQGGQIPATGAFEGIADTDGTKGLSLPEINTAKAYNTYVNNIIGLKDIDASRAAFKASFTDRMAGAHEYGYSKRAIKKGDGPGIGTDTDGSSNKIDLGVSRLTNQRMYATTKDIKSKYDQIINAKSGDYVEGWDGKRTYRYAYGGEKNGRPFWLDQVWDKELKQFVTVGGNEDAAGGGGGIKHYTTNDIIGELIPQTMLSSSNKTKINW